MPSASGRMLGSLLYPVKLAVQLGLIGVTVASFLPVLLPQVPFFVSLESFTPQLVILGAILTVAAVLFRPRVLALVGPLGLAWNLAILWPYLPVGPIPAFNAWFGGGSAQATVAPGPKLKVVSANVWYRNDDYRAAVNYLSAADPDVVSLLEVTPQWLKALEPLYARYPYRIDCMDRMPPCETMLLSKLPILKSYAGMIDGRSPTIVWAEVEFQGRPIIVAATHLTWPLLPATVNRDATAAGMLQSPPMIGTAPLLQSQQAENLAQYLATIGGEVHGDIVLMGDFNGVPWGRTQAAFRAATSLDNRGPAVPTWPSWQPEWARLPIDHVFVGGDLVRLTFGHGNYINSDHLPVAAEIGWKAQ